jgi:signal transduction histidine kinase
MKILNLFENGLKKIRDNSQIWFSIFVGTFIISSFVYIAGEFYKITQDTIDFQSRDRLGYLVQSFSNFVPEKIQNEEGIESLQESIVKLSLNYSTVEEFKVVKLVNGDPLIIASLNKTEIGSIDEENRQIYDLTKINPNHPISFEEKNGSIKTYKVAKIVQDKYAQDIAAVFIKQFQTGADINVQNNIVDMILVFIVIVIVIAFLFFRQARIIDYTSLYKKLQEVDSLKDDFISMASHELRSPLTVIRGYAEELRESGELPKDLQQSAERIDISAKQLDNLVGDMLDVSRIEQGRMKIDVVNINPVEILSEVVSGFKTVAKDKGLDLSLKHSIKNEVINVDPAKFRQVLVNLIGNAIKYTPKGDVKVNAKVEGGEMIFRVSDSGIGISAEDQKNLFKKFSRIKNSETAEIRGTGLGLWITKQIVEQMNGTITVESIKGVGTHFVVKFGVV